MFLQFYFTIKGCHMSKKCNRDLLDCSSSRIWISTVCPGLIVRYVHYIWAMSSENLHLRSLISTFVVCCLDSMDRVKRIWYLSPMQAAKVQASLRISEVSPEPSLLAHTSSESRGTFRQKARSLAPLNGWACAVKICHDGMLKDTNSLDGARTIPVLAKFKISRLQTVCSWSWAGWFYSYLVANPKKGFLMTRLIFLKNQGIIQSGKLNNFQLPAN